MSYLLFALIGFIIYVAGMFYYQHWVYKKDYTQYKGEWAVVTGASYGIGRSLAFSLASRGLNLFLIARSKDKLEQVAKEVKEKYKVEVKVLAYDLLKKESYVEIGKEIQGATMLINNVGGISPSLHFMPFLEYNDAQFQETYQLNLWSTVDMTRVVLPKMLEKKRGIILNISSVASKIPYWMTPYASAKCAVNAFSQAMHKELASSGVIAQGIIVGMVDTPLTESFEKVSPEMVGPDELAEAIVNQAGFFGYELIPHPKHHFFTTLLMLLPDWIRYRIIESTYKKLKSAMDKKK